MRRALSAPLASAPLASAPLASAPLASRPGLLLALPLLLFLLTSCVALEEVTTAEVRAVFGRFAVAVDEGRYRDAWGLLDSETRERFENEAEPFGLEGYRLFAFGASPFGPYRVLDLETGGREASIIVEREKTGEVERICLVIESGAWRVRMKCPERDMPSGAADPGARRLTDSP